MTNQDQKENVKWGVRQRLEFMERHLYWQGQINRKTIMDKTGVSKAQASLDLALYKDQAPENMTYSLSDKTYYLSSNFKPLYINTSPEKFLRSLPDRQIEQISLPTRSINSNHLRILHKAIETQSWISIEYQSLSNNPKSKRTIAPHHYVSDGRRWHIRAYDFSVSEFRDFVLGRIIHVEEIIVEEPLANQGWKCQDDEAWSEYVELILCPHPSLSKEHRAIIETDYGMEGGQARFEVRKACLFYVVAQMHLFDELPNPRIQQIILKNKLEIEKILQVDKRS
nr:WYL domain-containing protein [uncultured Desulfuromonas sp.]